MMPVSVLEEVSRAIIDYEGQGFSILELNHRSEAFDALKAELKSKIRSLLNVPEEYEILFCPGGGRLQFSMAPLNLLTQGKKGGYIVTGKWSELAAKECGRISSLCTLWAGDKRQLPKDTIAVPKDVSYIYYCDNETVDGTEFRTLPSVDAEAPCFVADLSSNFMSRPVDVSRFGAIWAGVQKNFGASGLSVLIVRRDLVGYASEDTPLMLDWDSYLKTDSVPNSVPVLQFYVALLMARWVEAEGGLEEMDRRAKERSRRLYDVIDANPEVYLCDIPEENRSRMNVVFTLRDETLLDDFVRGAEAAGMINLRGHRSRGGLRVSLYNAMPMESVEKLVSYMLDFSRRHAG